jgi:RecB family exonuclease
MAHMPFEMMACGPADVLATLGHAIHRAKGGDRLRPVTVIVPTNVAGVMARRGLGRAPGILGVDMVTLNRLAELLAGPGLAHDGRRPTSTPLLDLTIRQVLGEAPGLYEPVAHHPATIVALRELHQELRLQGADSAARLADGRRGRDIARISAAVTRILRSRWYDEADLFAEASARLRWHAVPGIDDLILHLPQPFPGVALDFVRDLGRDRTVTVVSTFTGDADADAEPRSLAEQLGLTDQLAPTDQLPVSPASVSPQRIVSVTDADDEVRVAVRTVVDSARGAVTGEPVPLERIAVLWPTHSPYARLVEHHLDADGIPWNGRAGTELVERIAPRLLLELLSLDRRGLGRRELFEFLADLPLRDAEGRPLHTSEWERVSREAGVTDDDWERRLGRLSSSSRWGDAARSLSEFVSDLRTRLGRPSDTRTWAEWVDWCAGELDHWLGKRAIARLNDSEYRAWETLMSTLERLRSLDEVTTAANRHTFRTVLEAELDDASVREGRIGTGITIGSLASAGGLMVDVAVILGGAEGHLPPAPRVDPLLGQHERELANLPSPDQHARRLHHAFVSTCSAAHTVVTFPRGDLRTTTTNQPSRWFSLDDLDSILSVDSSTAGIASVDFPSSERERRLRDRLLISAGGLLDHSHPQVLDDTALSRSLEMNRARATDDLTEYDGDLSAAGVDPITITDDTARQAVSPTQLQSWASCPHAYFVHYLLGVRPVEEPNSDIGISRLDQGSLQHDVLDRLHRDVLAGKLPQPTTTGWTDEHRTALLEHFDAECELAELSGRTGRPAAWAIDQLRLQRDLLTWLDHDSEVIRRDAITILASEWSFPEPDRPSVVLDLDDGRRLAVKGHVDRLDGCANGRLVVTDHKTGKATPFAALDSSDPTLGGTTYQLPVYAAAALTREGQMAGGIAVRAEYSMFERGDYRRIGLDFDDDVWATVRTDLTHLVDGIERGWFPGRPARPGFRLWVDCTYCEPDGLGTDDAFERWSRKRHDPRVARWFGPDDAESEDAADV